MAARSTTESAFSHNGQHFANVSTDGRLKIWECEGGLAKQEFVPTAHLSTACTCLVWAPVKQPEQSPNKSKKRKSVNGEDRDTCAGSDIVALGTVSGTILLYSLNRAELIHQLTGGHSEKVHSLCWNQDGTSLFSASSDRKIIEWNAVKGVIKSQWKADKGPVFRIAMLPDNCTLVTAGRSIHCWDVKKRTVVTTFTGHSTNINQLVPVQLTGDKSGYFLSSAEADRCITAWRFTGPEKNGQSLASFALQDDPLNFAISRPASNEDPVVLVAVTVTGILHVYEHHLNGRTKAPLQPKVKIQIGSDIVGATKTLPILAAYPFGDKDGNCLFVYGTLVKPGFEKMCYRNHDGMAYIIRKDPMNMENAKGETVVGMKTRAPILPPDVKMLAPEYMVPASAGTSEVVANGRKRRTHSESNFNQGCTGKGSLPMEQRLSALNLDKTVDAVAPPLADNMAQLLLQGLHSRDPKILQSVLDRGEMQMITNTVRRIPVQAVLPLLTELTRMMQLKVHANHSYAKWLRSLLEYHAGYLTSCPDLSSALTPVLALMSARTSIFPKMSQLRGRLHLMLGELEHRNQKQDSSNAAELPATALLVYREESSDEASEEGDWPLQSGSESEDQWDELSDYGMEVTEAKEDSDQEIDAEEENGQEEQTDDDEIDEDDNEEDSDSDDDIAENGLSD